MEELKIIQEKLNAPKTLRNNFGNYNYRSAESILEAVKPLLKETGCTLILDDELVCIGDRYYVKSVVELENKDGKTKKATGYAREEESKKGMDGSQITGASSSYARKYALNGLFAIDDEKDSDATNTHSDDIAVPQKAYNNTKTGVSNDEHCPACNKEVTDIKSGTTKTGKPYEMGNCECGEKFFINRK